MTSGRTFLTPAFLGTAEALVRGSPVSIPSATGTPVNRPRPTFPQNRLTKHKLYAKKHDKKMPPWGGGDSLSPESHIMAKPSKQTFLTLLKLALLGVSLPLAVSSQSWVRAATVRHNSPEYAQVPAKPTPQPAQPPAAKSPPAKPPTSKPSPSAATQPALPPKPQPTPSPVAQPSLPVTPPPAQPPDAKKTDKQKQPNWLLIATVAAGIGAVVYLGVLRFRPLWLLRIPSELKIPRIPPRILAEIPIPISVLLFLKYRPRVLEAWVAERIDSARKEFERKKTVEERKIHIPMPVELNGKVLQTLTVKDLQKTFAGEEIRLLICGEGGAGKTSLACQLAQWAMAEKEEDRLRAHLMIPVLIEEELSEPAEGKSPFLEAIAVQLKNLRDEEEAVSEELVKQLLKQRRVLVIADHLSEMSESSRAAIALKDPKLPVNALAVTSRVEDILGKDVNQTTLKPQRVSSGSLLQFMDAYLTQRGKRGHFSDDFQYIDDFKRLSHIVTDQRDVTLLFAKLYLELMIAAAEGRRTDDLPANVPDLMLSYINELNQNLRDKPYDDATVQQALKVVAWKCLQPTFKPEIADRHEAIADLAALRGGEEEAKQLLKYLEKNLALLRTQIDARYIRFTLDPLAEYLAGLCLVEDGKDDAQKWRNFLADAESNPGCPDDIKGFLLAVRDCCLSKGSKKVPDFVAEELGKLAGLDLEALKQAQRKRRIQRRISELSVPEVEDRRWAAKEIGLMGSEAKLAASALVKALKDEDSEVRSSAAEALGELGNATDQVLQALQGLLADRNFQVRLSAAEALGKLGNATEPVLQKLLELQRDSSVRSSLTNVLRYLDNTTEPALQALLGLLTHSDSGVRSSAAQVLGELGNATEPVLQTLLGLLADSDSGVRSSAAQALGKLGNATEPVLQTLLGLLADSDSQVRSSAAEALGKLGNATEPVLQTLLGLLADSDFVVRLNAAEALGELGKATEPVLQALLGLLEDSYSEVRLSAAEALGNLGKATEPVLQALLGLLADRDFWVRWNAAQALGELGNATEPVLLGLLKLLEDSSSGVRLRAAEALGNLGNPTEPVVQGLQKLLADEDSHVRRSAAEALAKLGHPPCEPV